MDCKSAICDANNLYYAYEKTIKGSKWKETTQKFALNYLINIFDILDELENKTYKPGNECHFILHERGKIRPITTLAPKDRVVRHVLCDEVLFPTVFPKLIYDNYASIKGRGVYMARKRFEVHLHRYYIRHRSNEGYILFGDFQKFYDNIIHSIAKEQFLKLFDYDPYLNWLLTVIFNNFKVDVSYMSDEEYANCINQVFNRLEYNEIPEKYLTKKRYMNKSVNIGDQLSQVIGIYYPNEIDTYIKTVLGIKEYGRYMDDFYIMSDSKQELNEILNKIIDISEKLGIHINLKKTRIVKMDSTYTYLQIKYQLTKSGHIIKRINPKRVTSMRRRLKKVTKIVYNGETPYIFVEEMFRSWMGGYYKYMSKKQRTNLIRLFETLFDKEVKLFKQSGKYKLIILNKKEETQHDVQSTKHANTNTTDGPESDHGKPAKRLSTGSTSTVLPVSAELEQTGYDYDSAVC